MRQKEVLGGNCAAQRWILAVVTVAAIADPRPLQAQVRGYFLRITVMVML